ncbi:MAG: cytochrome c [Planctomycetes bacterium]|nr:cytochrome c [Planctomycetota bacterium]
MRQIIIKCALHSLLIAGFVALSTPFVRAEDGEALYSSKGCVGCHTGGTLAPDLSNILTRRDRGWVERFIKDPNGMKSSDGDAQALDAEWPANNMIQVPMTDAELAAIIDYVNGGVRAAAPVNIQNDAATVDRGRRLFTGEESLSGGGPACISCHNVDGLGGLGGGRLADATGQVPKANLTLVADRMITADALFASIKGAAFPVMNGIFVNDAQIADDEAMALTAFLSDTALRKNQGALERGPGVEVFIIGGLVGLVVVLFAFDFIWRKRFVSVRSEMVGG